jgi:Mg2+/Co2+ transporter CorB
MVKKTSTRIAAANASLGYVVNDEELLDEILGECDRKHHKQAKKNNKVKQQQQQPVIEAPKK